MEATTRFTPHPAGESDGSSKFVQKRRGSMASYGAISEAPVAARRPGRALVLAAATMALSAAALLTAMTVKVCHEALYPPSPPPRACVGGGEGRVIVLVVVVVPDFVLPLPFWINVVHPLGAEGV
jgi:hypothetical protein